MFVEAITATGGLAAVDDAYQNPPQTSEQVLDPARYARQEPPRDLAPLTVELAGWDLYDEATFGDWGLRLVLDGSVPPGEVTQAASGWGNDTYRVFTRGDDVAMVMSYVGDSERDAEELARARETEYEWGTPSRPTTPQDGVRQIDDSARSSSATASDSRTVPQGRRAYRQTDPASYKDPLYVIPPLARQPRTSGYR